MTTELLVFVAILAVVVLLGAGVLAFLPFHLAFKDAVFVMFAVIAFVIPGLYNFRDALRTIDDEGRAERACAGARAAAQFWCALHCVGLVLDWHGVVAWWPLRMLGGIAVIFATLPISSRLSSKRWERQNARRAAAPKPASAPPRDPEPNPIQSSVPSIRDVVADATAACRSCGMAPSSAGRPACEFCGEPFTEKAPEKIASAAPAAAQARISTSRRGKHWSDEWWGLGAAGTLALINGLHIIAHPNGQVVGRGSEAHGFVFLIAGIGMVLVAIAGYFVKQARAPSSN